MIFKTICLLCVSLIIYFPGFSQNDTIQLKEVTIQSSRNSELVKEVSRSLKVISKEEINRAAINSLDEVLKYYGGMDIRSRGPMGIQSDISMRGGTFDQNLILINGTAMNDPQTGHHSLNLPVLLENIQKIEILEGSGSRWFGPNAYSGGINIITTPPQQNSLAVSVKGGQHQTFGGSLHSNYLIKSFSNSTSIGYNQSAGYTSNTDFNILNINHQTVYIKRTNSLAIHLGYLNKAFGANSFYTAKYPDQFEQIRTTFTNLKYQTGRKIKLSTNLYWRRLNDRFELFREHPDWYVKRGDVYVMRQDTAGFPTPNGLYPYQGHNYHRTDVWGADASISFDSKLGKTSAGASYRTEKILSNVLGEKMNDIIDVPGEKDGYFSHSKERQNITAFIEQSYNYKRFSVSGGISVFNNTDYGPHFSPGIDIGYFIDDKIKVYATANKSLRLPTFTDLYYQGPSHISNPNLKPEEAISLETGLKYFKGVLKGSASIFYRQGKNIIDWVKPDAEAKWESQNITALNTSGISLSASYINNDVDESFLQHAGLQYTFIKSNKSSGEYISLYALDYLSHHVSLYVNHKITGNFSAGWSVALQQRNGNYFDYDQGKEVPYTFVAMVNTRIMYQHKRFDAYIEASNLLNQEYRDISSVVQPGVWVMAGISIRLVRT